MAENPLCQSKNHNWSATESKIIMRRPWVEIYCFSRKSLLTRATSRNTEPIDNETLARKLVHHARPTYKICSAAPAAGVVVQDVARAVLNSLDGGALLSAGRRRPVKTEELVDKGDRRWVREFVLSDRAGSASIQRRANRQE
ncbi:MAG: hypothetical protein ABI629_05470 [bacterium]